MQDESPSDKPLAVPLDGDTQYPIQIDATALASVIREQRALPVAKHEAERLARAIETSSDDEAFLTHALSALRVIVGSLDDASASDPLEPTNPIAEGASSFDERAEA